MGYYETEEAKKEIRKAGKEIKDKYTEIINTIELDPKYESIKLAYKGIFIENFIAYANWARQSMMEIIDKRDRDKYGKDIDSYSYRTYRDEQGKTVPHLDGSGGYRKQMYQEDLDELYKPCCYDRIKQEYEAIKSINYYNNDLLSEMFGKYINQFVNLLYDMYYEQIKAHVYDDVLVSRAEEERIAKEKEQIAIEEARRQLEEYNKKPGWEKWIDDKLTRFVNREKAPTLPEGYFVLFVCLGIEFIFNHRVSWWILTISIFLCWRKREIDKFHGRGNKKDPWKW